MKQNIILIINVFIFVFSKIFINYFYDKNDKDFYRCSKFTHSFGLIFPIINIIFILLIQKNLNSKMLIFSFVCLLSLTFTFLFHIKYDINTLNKLK